MENRPNRRLLVVVPGLDKLYAVREYSIYDPVLMGNPPAPATGKFIPQRLGLADSSEGISEDCSHKIEDSERGLAICFNPAPQILSKMCGNDGDPCILPGHTLVRVLFQPN